MGSIVSLLGMIVFCGARECVCVRVCACVRVYVRAVCACTILICVFLVYILVLLCSWLDSFFWIGYKHELKQEDLYAIPEEAQSQYLLEHFDK